MQENYIVNKVTSHMPVKVNSTTTGQYASMYSLVQGANLPFNDLCKYSTDKRLAQETGMFFTFSAEVL